MQFACAKDALMFYVENVNSEPLIPCTTTLMVTEDGGARLQYSTYATAGTPAWALTIDVVEDLESLLKTHLTPYECRVLLTAALNDFNYASYVFDGIETRQGIRWKTVPILDKFTAVLIAAGYLPKGLSAKPKSLFGQSETYAKQLIECG